MKKLIYTVATLTFVLSGTLDAQGTSYPRVRVETTSGSFVIELNTSRAPITVANFLQYVENGFYEGTVFHRVIAGFMVQGGGYTAKLEVKPALGDIVNESGNGLSNVRGSVAMARTAEPHSSDSQFFVNLVDNQRLDPLPTRWGYAVFGEVIEGMEVIDEIGHSPTGPGGPFSSDVPAAPVTIQNMTILDATEAE